LEQLEILPKDKWYLLIANHQSWNDVFILQFIFRKILPFQKYFVKEEMRKFPLMGFIWEAMDCPFLKRREQEKNKQDINNQPELSSDLLEIKEKSKKFKLLPSTIVSFAEGTRFTEHKHAQQQSPYKLLLKPKVGGLACILEELHREIKGIVDVSLYYQPRNAEFWDLFSGDLHKISIKITYLSIPAWLIEKQKTKANYNDYKIQFQDWINNVWLEKDKFMQACQTHSCSIDNRDEKNFF
jgi:1-acyl-sn-glycerol-3-phosphate acyltransferase